MSGAWLNAMIDAAEQAPTLERGLSVAMGQPLRIGALLRAKNGNKVFEATAGGHAVIVKQFGERDGQLIPARAATELARLAETMSAGLNRAVACLHVESDLRCLVLERAPGECVQSRLDDLGPGAARDALLAHCGAWLATYVGDTTETGQFGPHHWIDQRRLQHAGAGLDPDDDVLLACLLDWMTVRAPALGGHPVTRGAVHGDFTPMNLHVDGNSLWGFDIQGFSRLPVARDLARFVVTWLRSSDLGHGRFPWPELAALSAPVLPRTERETILPFFVAEQLAGRWAVRYGDRTRKARMRAAIETFLEDAA